MTDDTNKSRHPVELYEAMQYGALTVDTQAFNRSSFRFSSGLLKQLHQLKDHPVEMLLSSIITNEVHRQLSAKIRETRNGILSSLEGLQSYGLTVNKPELPHDENAASKDILKDFVTNTGATIVHANTVDTAKLLDLYFQSKPPFDKTKKKNEFPDAMALLTMEKWAQEKQKKILAVSYDGDWKTFGEGSQWIDVVDDIETALNKVQKIDDGLKNFVQKFITVLAQKSDKKLVDSFTEMLSDALQMGWLEGDGYSYLSVSFSDVEGHVTGYQINDDSGDYLFKVISIDEHRLVISGKVYLDIDAESFATMTVYDSIDKDEVYIGGAHVHTETQVEVTSLITVLLVKGEDPEIEKVELTDSFITIDFGHVEPERERADEY